MPCEALDQRGDLPLEGCVTAIGERAHAVPVDAGIGGDLLRRLPRFLEERAGGHPVPVEIGKLDPVGAGEKQPGALALARGLEADDPGVDEHDPVAALGDLALVDEIHAGSLLGGNHGADFAPDRLVVDVRAPQTSRGAGKAPTWVTSIRSVLRRMT